MGLMALSKSSMLGSAPLQCFYKLSEFRNRIHIKFANDSRLRGCGLPDIGKQPCRKRSGGHGQSQYECPGSQNGPQCPGTHQEQQHEPFEGGDGPTLHRCAFALGTVYSLGCLNIKMTLNY